MKRRTLITALQYIIFLGLGIGIIYRMSTQMSPADKEQMMSAIRQTRLWVIIPVVVAGFFSHFFRALRWKLLLKPLGIKPSTVNITLSVLIGYVVNLALPRMGEVAKCTVLARYEHVPADKMVGTIVAERAFDVVCLGLITIAAFTLQADVIGNYAQSLLGELAAKRTLLIGAVTGLCFLILFLVFLYRRNKESKIAKFILGMSQGVGSIMKIKDRGLFFFYTALIWGLYWFLIILGFWAMPATEHLSLLCGLVVLIFGSIGIIATPGGLGAYPALIGVILVFYGLDKPTGTAFGWVAWTVQTGIIIILGLLSLVVLPIYNRNRISHAQAGMDKE